MNELLKHELKLVPQLVTFAPYTEEQLKQILQSKLVIRVFGSSVEVFNDRIQQCSTHQAK